MSNTPIKGIYVPNITPYHPDGTLNEGELRNIVSWLIDKGVSGIFPNGSLGEFIRLSFEERKKVISIIADEVDGRVPILAGAAEPNTDLVLEMCHHCADLGCRAVSITGPYYFKPSQESIEAYFQDLAERSPIDIVVYNIPTLASEISVPVLTRLALNYPRIVGTKDSSADMCRFLHVMNAIKPTRPDFSVMVGWEELLVPTMMMGGDGGTVSTAGVAPEVMMKIYHDCVAGNWEQAKDYQYKLLELFQTMLTAKNFPTGFRLGYEARGFTPGGVRFPNAPSEVNDLTAIKDKISCLLGDCGLGDLPHSCSIPNFEAQATYNPVSMAQSTQTSGVSRNDVEDIVRKVMRNLNI
ncbi:dihydrodipicolinate synthase family protein [Verrucomicrobiaceae bacterium N1E253]|uniref:Dihydrodipicolinate synthase family protein n=1 Tax=Oceaniferula marina TaxID=2748318 RepID=A0A851GJZ1_9BACT|nr:dihydrodipicolinate synthase family protein [Oceaniferula marina]NWK56181.1 dihydrodipicolinate synthase family protein [Oceaniferula marina]